MDVFYEFGITKANETIKIQKNWLLYTGFSYFCDQVYVAAGRS